MNSFVKIKSSPTNARPPTCSYVIYAYIIIIVNYIITNYNLIVTNVFIRLNFHIVVIISVKTWIGKGFKNLQTSQTDLLFVLLTRLLFVLELTPVCISWSERISATTQHVSHENWAELEGFGW